MSSLDKWRVIVFKLSISKAHDRVNQRHYQVASHKLQYQWPFNCELVNFFLSSVINYYSIKINMKVFIETKETTGQIFIYRCQSV